MSKSRLNHFERQEVADPLRLQPRDIALLRDVAEFRFVNTEQVLALHMGSRRNLMERLSRLYHHGYLDRPSSQNSARLTSAHMVYSLGRKGAELLSKDAEEREMVFRRVSETERILPLMAHALMISQFRVCLVAAAKERGITITRFTQGYDLKELLRDVHGEKPFLIPDAFFTMEDKDDIINFFVEADQGTMTTERFVNKLKNYWEWRSDERLKSKLRLARFRVLTIAPSVGRSDSLRRAGKGGDPRGEGSLMFLFTSETQYSLSDPQKVLERIWKSPKDDTPHTILE